MTFLLPEQNNLEEAEFILVQDSNGSQYALYLRWYKILLPQGCVTEEKVHFLGAGKQKKGKGQGQSQSTDLK